MSWFPLASAPVGQRRLEDYYEIGLVLGNGGFGSVYSGRSLATGDNVRMTLCVVVVLYG